MLGFFYFLRGDADACVRGCEAALTLNPNHANLLGVTGNLLALVGKWERGLSLMQRAMRLNPHYPGWYHFILFFNHYRKANYEAALEESLRINIPGLFMDPLIRAAVLGQLGRKTEAESALRELLRLLRDLTKIGRELTRRIVFSEEHVEILWDGLRKAGL